MIRSAYYRLQLSASDVRITPSEWTLNPNLPTSAGSLGSASKHEELDFKSSIWTPDVHITVADNQLLLVYGGLAHGSTIGELGLDTECFVIASRGPLNITLDIMGSRLCIETTICLG